MSGPAVYLSEVTKPDADQVIDVARVIDGAESLADVAVRLMALGSDLLELRAQGWRLAFEVGPFARLVVEKES